MRRIPEAIPVTDIDATGTPSATTYLRGDGSWATPSGGGGGGLSDGDYGDVVVSGSGTVMTVIGKATMAMVLAAQALRA